MHPTSWNRPLPPILTLVSCQEYRPPLRESNQAWAMKGRSNHHPSHQVESITPSVPGEITLLSSFSRTERKQAAKASFHSGQVLDHFSWDWLSFHYSPIPDLDVEAIHWVPDPRVICGSYHVSYQGPRKTEIELRLTCLDKMGQMGIRFSRETYQGRRILSGRSERHNLILYLSGSLPPTVGPQHELSAAISVQNKQPAAFRWILVLCDLETNAEKILDEAIQQDWAGEISRRKVSLSNQILFQTGKPDLDFSLAFSQRQARVHLQQCLLQDRASGLPHPALNSLQAWQLIQACLPMQPNEIKNLLQTIFQENGRGIDFPLQAELLSHGLAHGVQQDQIIDLYRQIDRNLRSWFIGTNDKDEDGIPENPPEDIFHVKQFCAAPIEESGPWQMSDQIESPALAALLLNELRQVKVIQDKIPGLAPTSSISDWEQGLQAFILDSWLDEGRFKTRHYQTHQSGAGYTVPGPISVGWNPIQRELPFPSRLTLQLRGISTGRQLQELQVMFMGLDWQDRYRVEEMIFQDLIWPPGGPWGITKSIFKSLDHLVIKGIIHHQEILIQSLDSNELDLSLTLPLWMEDLPQEISQKLSTHWLLDPDRYGSEWGLRTLPGTDHAPIQLPLNALVIKGLIRSGQGKLAAEIFQRVLETSSHNQQQTGHLYSAWDAESGSCQGKEDQVESLIPIGLLLDLLRVQCFPDGTLKFEAGEPYLFPVRFCLLGAEINIEEHQTTIKAPGKPLVKYSRQETAVHAL